ncbi:MAG: membrane protein insertase YidC [Oscillospiraceae bacterium]|nr:membrane protein insertase YidC [Oscillospiraceae bacterium]MBQ8923135.1 membrane protein insertase YidC [Oscillospiraceae bacterium]
MFDLIAIPFGWVMWAIYQVVRNYGLSILIFTIFIKLLTMHSTYKMQVNQARIGLLSGKIAKLRKSYANNQQRFQEEQNKLYTEEGVNPSAGCLSSFLTMFLLFGVYRVVLKPLTFILRIDANTLKKAQENLTAFLGDNKTEINNLNGRPELIMLKYRNTPGAFGDMSDFAEKISKFNVKIFGIDLTAIPTFKPDKWTVAAVMLVSVPILAALVQLAMSIISQIHSKKSNPDNPAQSSCMMNAMIYLAPLMTIYFGMVLPAGLAWYWLWNSVFSLIISLFLYRYLSGERLVRINEKEKQKQLAKGPSWMQRMMEQSAQYQAEQQGRTTDANRTRYADGDDGMSRKERAEYEKKLIEAARKRAALKYGEELPEDDGSDDIDEDA